MKIVCTKLNCKGESVGRGLCKKHYEQWRRASQTQECSVNGCNKKICNSRGWCEKHYARWRAHGNPLTVKYTRPHSAPMPQRFWEKVDIKGEDECWLWQASLTTCGYGRFGLNGKVCTASVVAWELHHGRKAKKHILHSCDTPRCCNPSHLREGTHQENMADRQARNRTARGNSLRRTKNDRRPN